MEAEKFDEWCIIELFGHQRIAGKVSEQSIGGCSFIRVDVPSCGERQAFTRFFGQGAIYSMTPVTEAVARAMAERIYVEPISRYELPRLPAAAEPETGEGAFPDDDEEDDG